jgi:hypothetical protein
MVHRHLVNFFHNFSAVIAGMWKEKFETDRFTETFSDHVKEKLGPAHKPREKPFAFGIDLVHEEIE